MRVVRTVGVEVTEVTSLEGKHAFPVPISESGMRVVVGSILGNHALDGVHDLEAGLAVIGVREIESICPNHGSGVLDEVRE